MAEDPMEDAPPQPQRKAPTPESVAEMYRTAIKMASENKITTKNAWSLSLIDHMSELVDESHLVNFQKASCALEAGVKIYCGRVDDTFDATRRVLEALARRDENHDEDVPTTTEGRTTRKKKTGGPTLVENESALDKKSKNEWKPSFRRRGHLGDAAAAKDMALQRLAVSAPASVTFVDHPMNESSETENIVLSADLVPQLPTTLCPSIAALRTELLGENDDDHTVETVEGPLFFDPPEIPSPAAPEEASPEQVPDFDDDDDDLPGPPPMDDMDDAPDTPPEEEHMDDVDPPPVDEVTAAVDV